MSISALTETSRTATIHPSDYDHAINLVDATKPTVESSQDSENLETSEASGEPLSRKWTKGTLREEITRRKYAKWQEDKQGGDHVVDRPSVEDSMGTQGDFGTTTDHRNRKSDRQSSGGTTRLRDKVPFRTRRKATKAKDEQDYDIDILYENQRGAFWCGIPLYSAKSLLNLDPAGWQTSSFRDSPVNITNAQVPDPTWKWAWRTWYVDMSHDVDEEGWEYSFSFQPSFSWHGSHPWFHSFVRRRRWLRKRVRVQPLRKGRKDDMKAAHMLTADYFTIHPKRDVSPDSAGVKTFGERFAYYSNTADEAESEEDFVDIANVNALMTALKRARLDREKVAIITNFLDHGGDELHYLAEHMPDVMAIFIYQTSRRQVHSLLLKALDKAMMAVNDAGRGGSEKDEVRTRRKENLLKAVQVAGIHVNDQDYWSDMREKATLNKPLDVPIERKTLDATGPSGEPGEGPEIDENPDTNIEDEIKGIPDGAHTSMEPGIKWRKDSELGLQGKGKEKA